MQRSCALLLRSGRALASLRALVVGVVVCGSLLLGLAAPAGAFPRFPGQPPFSGLGPPAAPVASLVPITKASLEVTPSEATVVATVGWNAAGVAQGLVVGDLRVVAVDATTGLPTLVATKNTPVTGTAETYPIHITDLALLPALAAGNRVVITATQHKRTVGTAFTQPIYATVHQLQAGPSRGPVGNKDCSDRPIQGNTSYNNCDFTGAVLIQANLPNSQLEEADFTGSWLSGAALSNSNMAGASLAGTDMSRTTSTKLSAALAFAPGLNLSGNSSLNDDNFAGADLRGANFSGAAIDLTTFFTDDLRGSSWVNTRLRDDELTGVKLQGAKMQGITIDTLSSFYRAQLQEANLLGAKIADLPRLLVEGRFCNTTMPDGSINNRDC